MLLVAGCGIASTLTALSPGMTLSAQPAVPKSSRRGEKASVWRTATEAELRTLIPARAPVVTERIETEFRTASGVTDGRGRFIAGVVLITAGYSAEGKYSNWLMTQVPLHVGSMSLSAGQYVFGWTREDDALKVRFYEAATGKLLGEVDARRDETVRRVESFRVWPPGERSIVQLGRFAIPYTVEQQNVTTLSASAWHPVHFVPHGGR